jgi:protein-L-isoaspartate(D-aspartate) O-methyltransferase
MDANGTGRAQQLDKQQAALDAVDEGTYTIRPDGNRVPQSSARQIIATMLDVPAVQHGHHVLEIGTGTGYSTALLTHLVGDLGSVTSVEIDPALTARARDLLRREGRTAYLVTGDGREGLPCPLARFDRIIAWATVEQIPEAWTLQSASEAVIVTPVALTSLAKSHAVVRVRTDQEHGLTGETIIPGSFVEAHDQVLRQWLVPAPGRFAAQGRAPTGSSDPGPAPPVRAGATRPGRTAR